MNYGPGVLASVLLFSTCGFLNAASTSREETVDLSEHSFQSDLGDITAVRLHLKDGDFRIRGVDSDDITIRSDGKNATTGHMKVHLKRSGGVLDITFSDVPKNECQVTIAIPKEETLFARMRGGDMAVDGVTGSKDLELVGGDMSIQVPDPSEYGPVDLSVRFGDVSGSQFGNPKGWMGNSVHWDGAGKYRLHAHVFAGDLTLKP